MDLVLTDPPYDLPRPIQEAHHQEFLRVCRGDILVFGAPENQWAFDGAKYLFWVKPTSTKNYSKSYGRFVEMVFLYQRGRTWNTDLKWSNYTGVYTDMLLTKEVHPFEKPTTLLERFILIHTNPGDTVLDPFAGSGTTLLTAQTLSRNSVGCEINEDYYSAAMERLCLKQ